MAADRSRIESRGSSLRVPQRHTNTFNMRGAQRCATNSTFVESKGNIKSSRRLYPLLKSHRTRPQTSLLAL